MRCIRHKMAVKNLLFIVSLLIFSCVSNARANEYSSDQDNFLKTFRHSYANPSDVSAALRYAQAAVKIGNYEAAIPPLERILMFNPRLNEVRLEVGVLYYLLNSRDMAKKHLSIVAEDKGSTTALQQRARTYLAKL